MFHVRILKETIFKNELYFWAKKKVIVGVLKSRTALECIRSRKTVQKIIENRKADTT